METKEARTQRQKKTEIKIDFQTKFRQERLKIWRKEIIKSLRVYSQT